MRTNDDSRVVIGVCTYRRPKMLRACLDSLAAQIPSDITIEIVVVDNEEEPNNRGLVETFAASCPFVAHYVHQPRRGIAAARNAILDKALELGAEWIAMLDDDEIADRRWIADLMVQEHRQFPILGGRRTFIYPEPKPFWMPEKAPRLAKEGAPLLKPETSNIRFSMALIKAGLRFDDALGLVGGEDERFFRDAAKLGFTAHSTPTAITCETVHPERTTYRFLIARHYAHSAQVMAQKLEEGGTGAVLAEMPKCLLNIPLGMAELLIISPISALFSRRPFRHFALRGGKHLAHVAGTIAAFTGHLPQPYLKVAGH